MKLPVQLVESFEDCQQNFETLQALFAALPLTGKSWITSALINSWANLGAGFETAAYLKDPLGFVHLKGVVAAGVSATVIFTLPAGYRPGAITIHPAGSGGSPPVGAVVHIDTAGNVTGYYNTGSSDVGLSGITFLAEN